MKKNIDKERLFYIVVGIFIFLIGNRIGLLMQYLHEQGENYPLVIFNAILKFFDSFKLLGWHIGFDSLSLLCGFLSVGIAILCYLYMQDRRHNYREGEEHGSSRYGDIHKEAEPLKNPIDEQNMIMSKNIRISMDTRQTFLNDNVCCIGGSGSGKTRYYIKPNILQMVCNYVITDPKASLIYETGRAFLENGYDVKILNLKDLNKSMQYNPLDYIESPLDVYKFVNNLVENTTDKTKNIGGDQFFEKSEIALLTALTFLVMAYADEDEKNIQNIMELIDMAEASEEDENMKSELDILFDDIKEELDAEREKMDDDEFFAKNTYGYLALLQYNLYKKAAGKTAKSILISVGVRMAVFNLPEIRRLLEKDTINLRTIGKPNIIGYDNNNKPIYQKTVLFLAISDSDKSLNFIASIMYQQLFDLLYLQAEEYSGNKLPIHTRFMLDEFANIGRIPDFEVKIATMRSREISVNVVLQGLSQLKNTYKDSWETIFGNCDTTLFLGGKEYTTLEYLSKMIGNGTFDYLSVSETKGTNSSWSKSNQLISRALMDPAEIGRLKPNECLLHIRGQHIFKDKKYDLLSHKNIDLTADARDTDLANRNILSENDIDDLIVTNQIESQSYEPREVLSTEKSLLNSIQDMFTFVIKS